LRERESRGRRKVEKVERERASGQEKERERGEAVAEEVAGGNIHMYR